MSRLDDFATHTGALTWLVPPPDQLQPFLISRHLELGEATLEFHGIEKTIVLVAGQQFPDLAHLLRKKPCCG